MGKGQDPLFVTKDPNKPVIPVQIIATIHQALGIPSTFEFRDPLNRPYLLVPWGEPIGDMFA